MQQTSPTAPSLTKQVLGFAAFMAILTLLFRIPPSWAFLCFGAVMVHEFGHAIAMRLSGIKVLGIQVLPIGAMVIPADPIPPRRIPFVFLAGPAFGVLAAALSYAVYMISDDARFAGFATFIMAVNLFQLLPLMRLDGGVTFHVVLMSFSPHLTVLYASMVVSMVLVTGFTVNPWLIPIAVLMYVIWFPLCRQAVRLLQVQREVLRPLGKAYGVKAEPLAILAARAQPHTPNDGSAPDERAAAERVWNEVDAKFQENDDMSLTEFLRQIAEQDPRLSKLQALGAFLAHALLALGMTYCLYLADQEMSLREFWGVMIHAQ